MNVSVTFALAVPVKPRWLSLIRRTAASAAPVGLRRRTSPSRRRADHLAPGDGQYDGGTKPGRVTHQLTPRHPLRIVLARRHLVTTTVPCMNGWMEQT